MGICPTARGNVTGSRPLGFTSPKSTSAVAFPDSTPRYQSSTIAATCSAAHSRIKGRPFMSTSTTGVPVAATASSSCCCTPGRPRYARLAASPLMSCRSPSTRIATLARRAAATASANPAVDVSSIPAPRAYTTSVPEGTRVLIPWSTVTTSSGLPSVCQGPSGSSWLSARGPITAITGVARSTGKRANLDGVGRHWFELRHARLGAQHANYGRIHDRHGDPARAYQRRERVDVDARLHVHVHARRERATPRLGLRARDPVGNQLG